MVRKAKDPEGFDGFQEKEQQEIPDVVPTGGFVTGREFEEVEPKALPPECKAEGCERYCERRSLHSFYQWCSLHRKRLKRTGDVDHHLDCVVEGCYRKRVLMVPSSFCTDIEGKYSPFCKVHRSMYET